MDNEDTEKSIRGFLLSYFEFERSDVKRLGYCGTAKKLGNGESHIKKKKVRSSNLTSLTS